MFLPWTAFNRCGGQQVIPFRLCMTCMTYCPWISLSCSPYRRLQEEMLRSLTIVYLLRWLTLLIHFRMLSCFPRSMANSQLSPLQVLKIDLLTVSYGAHQVQWASPIIPLPPNLELYRYSAPPSFSPTQLHNPIQYCNSNDKNCYAVSCGSTPPCG